MDIQWAETFTRTHAMFPVGPTFSREPVPDSESVVRFQKGLDDAGQGVIDAVSELETALDAAPPVAVPLVCLAASVHALYTRLVLVGGDPGVAAEVRVACLALPLDTAFGSRNRTSRARVALGHALSHSTAIPLRNSARRRACLCT